MTTAQAAAVVSLTRVTSLSREFAVPRQNTSRRLFQEDSKNWHAGESHKLFMSLDEQREAWTSLQKLKSQEGGVAQQYQKESARRMLIERSNVTSPAPAPAPAADYSILDAVVQLTVRFPCFLAVAVMKSKDISPNCKAKYATYGACTCKRCPSVYKPTT